MEKKPPWGGFFLLADAKKLAINALSQYTVTEIQSAIRPA